MTRGENLTTINLPALTGNLIFIHTAPTACLEEREKIKILRTGNKSFNPHKYHCAGFTLLELLVVIFIAGLFASIVFVSFGKLHEKGVFNEAARKVFITLKHARETAIMERTTLIFKTNDEGNSYWLEQDGIIYGKRQDMPERISIGCEPIIFFQKGNSSGGRVTIKNESGREYSIEVDPVLGMPKVKGL